MNELSREHFRINLKELPPYQLKEGVVIFEEPCSSLHPEVELALNFCDCIFYKEMSSIASNEDYLYAIAASYQDNKALAYFFDSLQDRETYGWMHYCDMLSPLIAMSINYPIDISGFEYADGSDSFKDFVIDFDKLPEHHVVDGVVLLHDECEDTHEEIKKALKCCDAMVLSEDSTKVLAIASEPKYNCALAYTLHSLQAQNAGWNIFTMRYWDEHRDVAEEGSTIDDVIKDWIASLF